MRSAHLCPARRYRPYRGIEVEFRPFRRSHFGRSGEEKRHELESGIFVVGRPVKSIDRPQQCAECLGIGHCRTGLDHGRGQGTSQCKSWIILRPRRRHRVAEDAADGRSKPACRFVPSAPFHVLQDGQHVGRPNPSYRSITQRRKSERQKPLNFGDGKIPTAQSRFESSPRTSSRNKPECNP